MRKDVARVLDTSTVYAKELEEREYSNFHKWLSDIPHKQNHSRHSENRVPGAAEWILQHPDYIDWKTSSSSSILLLSGIAGSGKTSITSAVIDSLLKEQRQNLPGIPTLYLYCGDSEPGSRTATASDIMRSLTRQLAIVDREQRKIHEQIWLEYQRRMTEAKLDVEEVLPLSCGSCMDLMLDIFATNPAVIVLDAIEEMEEDSKSELLHALVNIRKTASSAIKIFLSSRYDTKTNNLPDDEIKVQVDAQQTRADMEKLVQRSISTATEEWKLTGLNVGPTLQAELEAFLLKNCGEM
jgi:Cdc6-like AAA superfamily ATPase